MPSYTLSDLSDSQLYRYLPQDEDRDYARRLPLVVRHWDTELLLWFTLQECRGDAWAHHIKLEVLRACRDEGRCFQRLFTQTVMQAIDSGSFDDVNIALGMRVAKVTFIMSMMERIRIDEADDLQVRHLNLILDAKKRADDAQDERERAIKAMDASIASMRALPQVVHDAWELPAMVPRIRRRRIKVILEDDVPKPS